MNPAAPKNKLSHPLALASLPWIRSTSARILRCVLRPNRHCAWRAHPRLGIAALRTYIDRDALIEEASPLCSAFAFAFAFAFDCFPTSHNDDNLCIEPS
jgi:hypothetical protein